MYRDVKWRILADTWTVPMLHGSVRLRVSGVEMGHASGAGVLACLGRDVDGADDARLLELDRRVHRCTHQVISGLECGHRAKMEGFKIFYLEAKARIWP